MEASENEIDEREGVSFDRLRLGEWIIGVTSIALLIDLLILPWYSLQAEFRVSATALGGSADSTGIQAYHILGTVVFIACLLGLMAWWFQATSRGPAVAVCLTSLTALFSVLSAVGLLFRVVFFPVNALAPGTNTTDTLVWAVLGLVLAWVMVLGSWLSLRADGIAAADQPQDIETLTLRQRAA